MAEPKPDTPPPSKTRFEEARLIIEEYAADLRELIKKFRQKMN